MPAGRFSAVRVEMTHRTNATDQMRTTCWYAVGVGLVKMSYRPRNAKVATNEVKLLKSFTPGKN